MSRFVMAGDVETTTFDWGSAGMRCAPPGTGCELLNCPSRRIPRFRTEGSQLGVVAGRCIPRWSAKPKKRDCPCIGLRGFPTRGRHWLRQSGCGDIRPPPSNNCTKGFFAAHFVLAEDLEDPVVTDRYARAADVDLTALHASLADGSAGSAVAEAELLGRQKGVQGTPAWLLNGQLIMGLRSSAEFELLAQYATG